MLAADQRQADAAGPGRRARWCWCRSCSFGRRVRRLSRASQDRVADVGAYVDEVLHEIRTVQAYGHEDVDRAAASAMRVETPSRTALQRIRQRAPADRDW